MRITARRLVAGALLCATAGCTVSESWIGTHGLQERVLSIRTGETTQDELLQLLGPPQLAQSPRDRVEVYTWLDVRVARDTRHYPPVIPIYLSTDGRGESRTLTVSMVDQVVTEVQLEATPALGGAEGGEAERAWGAVVGTLGFGFGGGAP